MKLTDKAKDDFEIFQIYRSLEITNRERPENGKVSFETLVGYKHQIWNLDEVYLNALIIEWFDSVGLQITVESIIGGDFRADILENKFKTTHMDNRFESRLEATNAVIERTNEIYNER